MENILKCKLECIQECIMSIDFYSGEKLKVNKGDILNCIISDNGVHIEYKEKHYSPEYYVSDIAKSFIIE